MKISIINQKGEKKEELTLNDAFDKEVSSKALTLYINYLRAALRDPIANTKDRSQVSGGGRKPYKQKGTGNSRQGSTRSPLWVGGGVTFGPTSDRNFKQSINKSTKKSIIASILGGLMRENKLIAVDTLSIGEVKTKAAASMLDNIKAEGKITVVFNNTDQNTEKSFRNLAGINLAMPNRLNIINILSSDSIVISKDALLEIDKNYTK